MAQSARIALVVIAVLVAGASAQPPADCTSAYAFLVPCYSYVAGTEFTPPSDCCAGISTLNANQPTCLCSAITQLQASPTVNVTKAVALPRDCNVAVNTNDCPALGTPPSVSPSSPPSSSTPPPAGSSPPPSTATPPPVTASPPTGALPPTSSTPPTAGGGTPPASGPGSAPSGPASEPASGAASALVVSWTFGVAAFVSVLTLL